MRLITYRVHAQVPRDNEGDPAGQCEYVPGPRFQLFPACGPGTTLLTAVLHAKVICKGNDAVMANTMGAIITRIRQRPVDELQASP